MEDPDPIQTIVAANVPTKLNPTAAALREISLKVKESVSPRMSAMEIERATAIIARNLQSTPASFGSTAYVARVPGSTNTE